MKLIFYPRQCLLTLLSFILTEKFQNVTTAKLTSFFFSDFQDLSSSDSSFED